MSYGGPSPLKYYYDANGARVVKMTSSTTTVYVYDAFGALSAEYSSNATAASVACDRCYLSTDQVGSTRMVTDVLGNVVSFHDYLAFGGELDAGYAGRTNPWGSTADNVSASAAAELFRFSTPSISHVMGLEAAIDSALILAEQVCP